MKRTRPGWAVRLPLARGAVAAALCLCAGLPGFAEAKSPIRIHMDAAPLFGTAAPQNGGWRTLTIRLENPNATAVQGNVEIHSRPGWLRTEADLTTSIPFALAPKARVSLKAPTRGFGGGAPSLVVQARGSDGETFAEATLAASRPNDALILDLSSPSRVAPLLREAAFISRRGPPYGGRSRIASIGVAAAVPEATTGDLVLPEFAAGYTDATLVIATGRKLARLAENERAALAGFVLSGGALALSLDRPEDLLDPLLLAVLGGSPEPGPAPPELRESATFVVPEDGAATSPGAPSARTARLAPGASLARKLVSYVGGNLRNTPWGAAASYGLGEVHLLAFDTSNPEVLSDPWTRLKLVDLSRHAFDREPLAVVRHAAAMPGASSVDGVRRELDPNQASRWTIVVSALALLLYAALAGPLSFYLAARKGRPLRALWQLPIWSAATLLAIVLLGMFGKGVSGRARRLSLFDAGAGMTQAAAARFRGFYAPSSRELTVRAGRREHVLDLAAAVGDVARTLVVDRDGPRLEGLRTKPWQTVLVREEGFGDLAGGVSLIAEGRDYLVKNRAARDLIGAVLRKPDGTLSYFPRIKDGQGVRSSAGRNLGTTARATTAGGGIAVPLGTDRFVPTIEADFPGLGRAWVALEPSFSPESEWWPPDAPVLIAALDGGEGKLTDSGFRVDYDRVLVRIVGTGGAP